MLDNPAQLGLPDYAEGNPEGYLFPATYDFGPDATPATMLKAMVTRWRQAADDADLENAAAALGYTPQELMTVASLVQAEGRGDDMPKIARVIYNRIENPGTAGHHRQAADRRHGQLRRSATTLGAVPTAGRPERSTRRTTPTQNVGLPPGPIESPGDDAIAAAAHPADGDWLYYVTVNLKTGETKFTETYDEFLQYKQELRDYCATESDRCCVHEVRRPG